MYIVKRQEEGIRLDSFLFGRVDQDLPGVFSRGALTEGIRCGQVVHNQKLSLKPSQKVRMNDEIRCELSLPEASKNLSGKRNALQSAVLFEDEQVMFINKPAGLMTHPVRQGDISLVDWIEEHYPQVMLVGDNSLRPGIVHRLDKDTSGVLVIAKTEAAFVELKRLFQERTVEKTYFALTEGHLSQSAGKITFTLTRIPHSEKRSVRRATNDPEARPAITHYRVLRQLQSSDFVEVSPKTGRTHQIRVHFSALQHPIIGDRLYGFRRRASSLKAARHMLHAGKLSLSLFGKTYSVESPLPEDFEKLLQDLTAGC